MKRAPNPTSPSFLTVISGFVLSTHSLRFSENYPVNWAVGESRVMNVTGGAGALVQQWTRPLGHCWTVDVRLPSMATRMPSSDIDIAYFKARPVPLDASPRIRHRCDQQWGCAWNPRNRPGSCYIAKTPTSTGAYFHSRVPHGSA